MVDTHAHLNDISESEKAVAPAERVGVSRIIAVGLTSNQTNRRLRSPQVTHTASILQLVIIPAQYFPMKSRIHWNLSKIT